MPEKSLTLLANLIHCVRNVNNPLWDSYYLNQLSSEIATLNPAETESVYTALDKAYKHISPKDPQQNPACKLCKFWSPEPTHPDKSSGGLCHLYPESIRTSHWHWCGHFKAQD